MKKYLSLILAVMMVLSCVSYAAPVAVGTVQSANEADVEVSELFEADLAQETETAVELTHKNYGTLAFYVDFDVAAGTTTASSGFGKGEDYTKFTTYVAPALPNMPADIRMEFYGASFKTDGDNLVMTGSKYPRFNLVAYGSDGKETSYPIGVYTIEYEAVGSVEIAGNAVTFRGINYECSKINCTTIHDQNTANNGKPQTAWPEGVGETPVNGGKVTTTPKTFYKSVTFDGTKAITDTGAIIASNVSKHSDMATGGGMSRMGVYMSHGSDANAQRKIDWVKIWYKPIYYTVSFENPNKILPSVEIVKGENFVPSEFVPAVLPDRAEAFLGWSLTKGGEIVTEPFAVNSNTTLYANYREKTVETSSAYGKLAYYIDFDVESSVKIPKEKDGNGLDINEFTTYVAPAISGMPAVVELESYAGLPYTEGGYLVIPKGNNYPRIWLSAYGEDASTVASFPEGKYVLEFEARRDEKSDPQEWTEKNNNTGLDEKKTATSKIPISVAVAAPNWPTTALAAWEVNTVGLTSNFVNYNTNFKYDGEKLYNNNGASVVSYKYTSGENKDETTHDASEGFNRIGIYSGAGNSKYYGRYIKNIKVWYAPLTVNVTYDANGKDVSVPETQAVDSTVKYANLPKLETCGTSRFAGWSETKNGRILTGEKLYVEDVTLYAVWDDNYYAPENEELNAGKLLAHIHFNNVSNTTKLNSQIVNYGDINKDFAVNHSSGYIYPDIIYSDESNNEHLSEHPANIWFSGDNAVFLYQNEDGTVKYDDNAVVIKAVKSAKQSKFYPKLQLVNNLRGTFRDGIYTFVAEVTVEDDENIVSVGYTGCVDNTATNLKTIKAGEKTYIKASVLIYNGKLYDYETMDESATLDTKLVNVGFNFDFKMKEAVLESPEITADNFRIYYKPYNGSSKSYAENSIRVINPAGIRFKASVSDIERSNESLTEYGFVVTRKILLDNAGIAVNDFTFDSDVVKVPGKSYDKAANIDKIFETNKNETFFTAVVYNIPAQAYKDDIVVRPYVKYGDNYVYGDAMVRNIYDVAVQLKASADAEKYGEALDKIINGEEL